MLKPLFSPEEAVDSGMEKPLGKEEIIELLAEEDVEEKEEVIELKEDDKEDKDELKEIEEELKDEEVDKDELELVTPVRGKEILAKYPTLWKDFPGLKASYYREREFTEMLGSLDDAKEAVSKAETLDKFEKDLSDGNIETALRAVQGVNENAFNKMVDDYLPTLARVNKDAYLTVVGNVARTIVNSMIKNSKGKEDDLAIAAAIVNKFVTGSDEVTAPTKLAKEEIKNDKEEALKKKEQELFDRDFDRARDTLSTKVDNILKGTISANIDPKGTMTDYVREKAIEEALNLVETQIDEDKGFVKLLQKLWQNSSKKNFSEESLGNIKSAYLAKAKQLLPTVIKGVRNKASKGSSTREVKEKVREEPLPAGHSRSQSRSTGAKSDREIARSIPKDVSSKDFLMQD